MENISVEMVQKKQWCEHHMNRYVLAQTHDGWCCDGFVEYIDDEIVCLAVPCGGEDEQYRQPFFPFGGPIYPYPYYPRRRFHRRTFPLAALLALSLLSFY